MPARLLKLWLGKALSVENRPVEPASLENTLRTTHALSWGVSVIPMLAFHAGRPRAEIQSALFMFADDRHKHSRLCALGFLGKPFYCTRISMIAIECILNGRIDG